MATKKVTNVQIPIDAHETFVSIRKSFVESGDVQEKLATLYELQKSDSQLDEIYMLRGELPAEVEALENQIAELSGKIDVRKEHIAAQNKKIAELELQKKANLAQVEKYKAQVDNIQNSREFDSLNKEIEQQELEAAVADKFISQANESIALANDEIAALNEKIAIRQDDLKAKQEELQKIAASTAKQEEQILAVRKDLASKIDARTMSAYERIRKSVKNHLAVVPIYQGNACGGCHSEIVPQRLIDIRSGQKLIICEYCGRILVSDAVSEEEEA